VCQRKIIRGYKRWVYELADLKVEKSPIYTLKLSPKSDFQPSTTKSDNIGHPTVETGNFCPPGGFEGGLHFSKKI